jgi:hypothetical protein
MAIAVGERSLPVGGVVAAVGGVVAAVGTFLAWETVNADMAALAGTASSVSGFSFSGAGKIVAVLAIISVALAIVWIMGVKLPISAPGLVVGVGAVCLAFALLGYTGVADDVNSGNEMVANIASAGIGIFVSIAGGAVIVVGGVLGLVMKPAQP